MTKSTHSSIITIIATLSISFCSYAIGQEAVPVSFRDEFTDTDFSDDLPVSWSPDDLGDRLDASSGDLVITTDGVFGTGFAILQDQLHTDVRVETQMRVLDSNYQYAGLGVRGTQGGDSYIGAFSRSVGDSPSFLNIATFRNRSSPLVAVPTYLDPTAEDVWLSFETSGNLLTLRAWSDNSPVDTISIEDNRIAAGTIIPFHAGGQGVQGSVFRYIEATLLEDLFDCDSSELVDVKDLDCATAEDLGSFLKYTNLKQGDADGDGVVAFDDFLTLSAGFGSSGKYSDGDFDLSGSVDFSDFLILSANFEGGTGAIASVPEPVGSLSLIVGIATLALIRSRRFASTR